MGKEGKYVGKNKSKIDLVSSLKKLPLANARIALSAKRRVGLKAEGSRQGRHA